MHITCQSTADEERWGVSLAYLSSFTIPYANISCANVHTKFTKAFSQAHAWMHPSFLTLTLFFLNWSAACKKTTETKDWSTYAYIRSNANEGQSQHMLFSQNDHTLCANRGTQNKMLKKTIYTMHHLCLSVQSRERNENNMVSEFKDGWLENKQWWLSNRAYGPLP